MKNLLRIFLLLCISSTAHAQAPAKFNYQGIARNASGQPISSQSIGLKIAVLDGSSSGPAVYVETHNATTNAYGLFSVAVGGGTPSTGTLAGVNWSSGDKYIRVDMDPAGGTAYVSLGTAQLLSVPFSMYSAQSAAPTAGTGINVSGNTVSAQNANPLWNANMLQGINVSTAAVASGQVLKFNGLAWAPAADIDNDAQTLSLVGSTLSISGGNNVTLPAGTAYTGGTGISIASGVISATNTAALWNANQLQGLAVSSIAPTSGQALKWNGASWAPATDNDAQTLSIAGTTLSLTNGGSVSLPGHTGTGTADYLTRWTGTNSMGTSLVYDNGSNVAIGTTTPITGAKLTLSNSSGGSGSSGLVSSAGGTAGISISAAIGVIGTSSSGIGVAGTSGSATGVIGISNATGYAGVYGGNSALGGYGLWGSTSTGVAGYFDGGASGVGISVVNGPVLVGAPAAGTGAKMHVKTGNTGAFDNLTIESPGSNNGYGVKFVNPSGSWAMGPNVGNFTDNRFRLCYGSSTETITMMPDGRVGIGTFIGGAAPATTFEVKSSRKNAILAYTDSSGGIATATTYPQYPAAIRGEYRNTGSNDGSGVVGIATAPPAMYGVGVTGIGNYFGVLGIGTSGGSSGVYAAQNGSSFALHANGNIGGSGTNSYTSDRKLKKNISGISNALDVIAKIKPSSYEFRVGEFGSMYLSPGRHYGVIAQELQTVLPELVLPQTFHSTDKSEKPFDYLSVNYNELIPILIKGMQEQQELIKSLEERLSKLEAASK